MRIKKTAFCTKDTCCPTWELNTDTDTVIITDDFGGSVTMPHAQWIDLARQTYEYA